MLPAMKPERQQMLFKSMNRSRAVMDTLENPYDFKIQLRYRRKIAGLSVTKLAKCADISVSYISEIENGRYTNPSIDILWKLSKALHCRIEDLVIKI